MRESLKEEEASRSREDRDQLTRRWTSWTTRPEVATGKTDVICERPLLKVSEGSTEVNYYLEGRVDAQPTWGTVDGNCGVGEVTVGNDKTLMDEAQNFRIFEFSNFRTQFSNFRTQEFVEVITEQHQRGKHRTKELAPT